MDYDYLLVGLIWTMFFHHCEKVDKDIEKRFQISVDEGASPDHTHKFAKGIKIPGQTGWPFTAEKMLL